MTDLTYIKSGKELKMILIGDSNTHEVTLRRVDERIISYRSRQLNSKAPLDLGIYENYGPENPDYRDMHLMLRENLL